MGGTGGSVARSVQEAGWLEVQVLGRLDVRSEGRPIRLSGHRLRALLVRLLLARGQLTDATTLIEAIWGGQPPSAATVTLHSHVARLRRALGPSRIHTERGSGYALGRDAVRVDAESFADEVATARGEIAACRPAAAARILRVALSRWHGPALAEFAALPWAASEAMRLEELRAVGTEVALEALLLVGDASAAVELALQAVARHPLREGLHACLIVALYRCDRQADALRAADRLRRSLLDDLGLFPSPRIALLEQAVLHQRPVLDWSPMMVAS